MEPTLIARDVYKSFGSGQRLTQILRGISMEVASGETVFLVGPSGSGKTTLLSLLGCLLTPNRGTIRVLGQDISRMRPAELTAFRRQNLGFVFQTFNLFPNLSAADNVGLALCMRGESARAARNQALELLEQVGLGGRAGLMPAQLSTGECQRVALARALAGSPAVLLADEPTASLDAANGQAVMELLHRLAHERNVTLVIVTHDDRILHYADRILRLEDGRLASDRSYLEPDDETAASLSTAKTRGRMRLLEEHVA